MTDGTRTRPSTEGEGQPADPASHAELERTVRELRADFEHLRRSLAAEVRTRRVVVVGDGRTTRVDPGYVSLEGDPEVASAITLQAGSDGAEVRLYSGPEERMDEHPHSTAISLYAAPGWLENRASDDGHARITFYAGSDEQHVISTDGHPVQPAPAVVDELLVTLEDGTSIHRSDVYAVEDVLSRVLDCWPTMARAERDGILVEVCRLVDGNVDVDARFIDQRYGSQAAE